MNLRALFHMLASLPDGCSCRHCGRLGSGSSIGAKRCRWRLLSLAAPLGLHSVRLSNAVSVALLPRLVGDLEEKVNGQMHAYPYVCSFHHILIFPVVINDI